MVSCRGTRITTIFLIFINISYGEKIVLTTASFRLFHDFNLTEYVITEGYPFEIYEDIPTEDGYLLTLHRIPYGINNTNPTKPKPVAFLMHGLGGTASNWVSGGADYAMGFLLADRGYDVWLGNARGSTHSKKHVFLDPVKDKAEFWDFSWHEIGYYDLDTSLNYVLNVTKQEQLFYVGYSQGCTAYIVLMTTRPEWNQRVKLMAAMAPAVYGIGDTLQLPKSVAYEIFRQIDFFRKMFGAHTDVFGPKVEEFACKSQFSNGFLCRIFLNMRSRFMGVDPSKTRPEHFAVIKQTLPDSSSIKQSMHYVQVALTDEFRQYHLGVIENRRKYGADLPPFYDLKKVTSRVAIFYGENDSQATPTRVERLAKILPNVVDIKKIPGFGHLDFIVTDSSREQVYQEIFGLMYNFA